MDILDAIGNTSLVRLRKVAPPESAAIFAKLESENPTGSMKDRMAPLAALRSCRAIAGDARAQVDQGANRRNLSGVRTRGPAVFCFFPSE